MDKLLNGKAIYSPKGKAGEYAKYACNFYVGCSNDCSYCYCKRGVLGHAMGAPKATLKKCFKDEKHALEVFRKELVTNLDELKKHGLFFTFTSDPFLPETRKLTIEAVGMAVSYWVPCKILTKRADFIDHMPLEWAINPNYRDRIAFGFTLTGHDELEPGASTNAERIETMRKLHDTGFRTFASIEPVVTPDASYKMIRDTLGYCDLYKIGLMSGKREYCLEDVSWLASMANGMVQEHNFTYGGNVKTYWKKSVLEFIGLDNENDRLEWRLNWSHCVGKDYNMFNQ